MGNTSATPKECFSPDRSESKTEQKVRIQVIPSNASRSTEDSWFNFADSEADRDSKKSIARPPASGAYPDICNAAGKVMLQKPRSFLMTAIGTRGDVQPLIEIGQRLQQDGFGNYDFEIIFFTCFASKSR